MTDISLYSDDKSVDSIADKVHARTMDKVSILTGRDLRSEEDDNSDIITEEENYNDIIAEEEENIGIMEGGILNILKTKYNKNLKKVQKEYRVLSKKKQSGGAGALTMFVVIIKLILMTTGSFIFGYFPVVMLISGMCVYIEYMVW